MLLPRSGEIPRPGLVIRDPVSFNNKNGPKFFSRTGRTGAKKFFFNICLINNTDEKRTLKQFSQYQVESQSESQNYHLTNLIKAEVECTSSKLRKCEKES